MSRSSIVSVKRSALDALHAQLQKSAEKMDAMERTMMEKLESIGTRRGAKDISLPVEGDDLPLTPRLTPGAPRVALPAEVVETTAGKVTEELRAPSEPSIAAKGRKGSGIGDDSSSSSTSDSSSDSDAEAAKLAKKLRKKARRKEEREEPRRRRKPRGVSLKKPLF